MARREPIYAKLSRPRLAKAVLRERLFAKLEGGAHGPVVWVWGPPGSGKTALVASYVEARGLDPLWYQVDSGDADLATFFFYLREGLRTRSPRNGGRLPLLTPEYLGDIAGFCRRFFRRFFAALGPAGVVVLDNLHEAEGSPPFVEILCHAVAEVPPGVRVILISRSRPYADLARPLANRSIAVVDGEDLRLTVDEARRLTADLPDVAAEWLPALLAQVQGWAAGLVLLTEQTRQPPAATATAPEPAATQRVFDYFAAEVFSRFPEATRAALCRLALAPSIRADGAAADDPAVRPLLEGLHERRLFTDRLGEPAHYEFHPLFRAFLLAEARRRFSANELAALSVRAAQHMERDGEIEAAMALFGEAGEWPELARMVLFHAGHLLAHGRYQPLEAAIARLPADLVDRDPWLLYWRGVARLPFSPPGGRALLERAYAAFREEDDSAGRLLTCAVVLRSYFFEFADFTGIDRWLPELEELCRRHPDFLAPEVEVQVLAAGFGIMYRRPDYPLLEGWAERALDLIHGGLPPLEQAAVSDFVVAFYTHRGDFAMAQRALEEIRRLVDPREMPPVVRIGLETWSGVVAFLCAQHGEAIAHLDLALAIAREHGVHVFDVLIAGNRVYALLGMGELDQAAASLQAVESRLLPARPVDSAFYHHLRSGLLLLQGDPEAARREAQWGLEIVERNGVPFFAALARAGLAQASIALGDYPAAARAVRDLRRFARAMPTHTLLFTALLLEAHLRLCTEERDAARRLLAPALALGREHGYRNAPPFWQAEVMARLCALALEEGIEVDYVGRLIRSRGLMPPENAGSAWPWPVRIHTLGRFELLRDGVPHAPSGKAQKRSLDLLKAIIALGGVGVDRDEIADWLWPDADGAAARSAFDMALHRLRRLLGHDAAVELHDGKVTLNARLCWVDVWSLERGLDELEAALGGEPDERTLAQMSRTLQRLYPGPFLAHDPEQGWLLPARDRLRRRYLRHLMVLGRHWEDRGRWQEAAEVYERGLEQEPMAEDLYRRLMHCHHARGSRSEALAAYHRCEAMLAGVLKTAPAEETQALLRRISTPSVRDPLDPPR